MTFSGTAAEELAPFLEQVQRDIFTQNRQRDDVWVAGYVASLLKGQALLWYYTLDEESQVSWKRLRTELIAKYATGDHSATPGPAPPPPAYSLEDPSSPTTAAGPIQQPDPTEGLEQAPEPELRTRPAPSPVSNSPAQTQ